MWSELLCLYSKLSWIHYNIELGDQSRPILKSRVLKLVDEKNNIVVLFCAKRG